MLSDNHKRWIEAAKVLGANPEAKVLCPKFGAAHLKVQDTKPFKGKKERMLSCANCGAREFMLMQVLN